MVKAIPDEEILSYLENHTYEETMDHFKISRMSIARIRKANHRYSPDKINLAIVGFGNAASALMQGIEYYRDLENPIGLFRPTFAGFHITDINVVCAIDISANKVGKDLTEALHACEFPVRIELKAQYGVTVLMGQKETEPCEETLELINPADLDSVDIADELKKADAEIVLCLLPSGADEVTRFYADQALKAGCAFINATPATIANDSEIAQKFREAGIPLIGDDLQDQFGATILHKMILQQMIDRGVDIKESYALDVGGGAESLNTLFRTKDAKQIIKTMSVSESLHINAPITAGTSDYVDHLGNGRNSFLWIVGKGFLGSEIIMDVKIQTEDGPNGGSVLADVVRATKVALNQGAAGPINEISAYGFKKPPSAAVTPAEANRNLANFILGVK